MTQAFNIYCDESCYLEHDQQKVIVLGSIWYPLQKATIHRQIDQPVYEIYTLIEEDIRIVEGETA